MELFNHWIYADDGVCYTGYTQMIKGLLLNELKTGVPRLVHIFIVLCFMFYLQISFR